MGWSIPLFSVVTIHVHVLNPKWIQPRLPANAHLWLRNTQKLSFIIQSSARCLEEAINVSQLGISTGPSLWQNMQYVPGKSCLNWLPNPSTRRNQGLTCYKHMLNEFGLIQYISQQPLQLSWQWKWTTPIWLPVGRQSPKLTGWNREKDTNQWTVIYTKQIGRPSENSLECRGKFFNKVNTPVQAVLSLGMYM